MPKQLYEEALADVKKVLEVAEDNAKRAILDAVTPRVKQLIEQSLLNEFADDPEMLLDDEPGVVAPPVPVAASADASPAGAISPPDEEGKVTLDLDALSACEPGAAVPSPMFGEPVPAPGDEYELSAESVNALTPVVKASSEGSKRTLQNEINKVSTSITKLKSISESIAGTKEYGKKIAQMISRVEDMYGYVQERVTDPAAKKAFEESLENNFQELTKLQELKMPKTLKDLIKEDESQLDGNMPAGDESGDASPGELTLKLTGLPDNVDLDSVGVDLVADEDDAGGEEALPVDDAGSEGGDEGGDLGDLDLGGSEEAGDQMESVSHLSDDTIVEIDENVLRREIARMKKIREANSQDNPPSKQTSPLAYDNITGVDDDILKDFGGGDGEGDAFLDGEVTTESDEADGDAVDESENMSKLQNRRKANERGESADTDQRVSRTESLKRRIAFEKRLQERAKARGAAIKKAAAANPAKKAQLQKEYAQVAGRHNASVDRVKKFSKLLAEAKKSEEPSSNSGSQPAESKAANNGLRKQLAEQSLLNKKLVYANKLLQNESLSKRQKAHVIERLDEAQTEREAKLVYESLTKAFAGKPIRENKEPQVLGSSSRATSTGSAKTLNEGFETDRWAQLAGITKRA